MINERVCSKGYTAWRQAFLAALMRLSSSSTISWHPSGVCSGPTWLHVRARRTIRSRVFTQDLLYFREDLLYFRSLFEFHFWCYHAACYGFNNMHSLCTVSLPSTPASPTGCSGCSGFGVGWVPLARVVLWYRVCFRGSVGVLGGHRAV